MPYNKKISEKEREKLNNYATSITGNTILATLAHDCISKEEIHVMKQIIDSSIMLDYRRQYVLHKKEASRNCTRILEEMKKEFDLVETENDRIYIWERYKAESPWFSKVKEIKGDAMDYAESLLKKAKIGKKRRIKIMTSLRKDFAESEYEYEPIDEEVEILMKKMHIL